MENTTVFKDNIYILQCNKNQQNNKNLYIRHVSKDATFIVRCQL